jgi:hypothetical protein
LLRWLWWLWWWWWWWLCWLWWLWWLCWLRWLRWLRLLRWLHSLRLLLLLRLRPLRLSQRLSWRLRSVRVRAVHRAARLGRVDPANVLAAVRAHRNLPVVAVEKGCARGALAGEFDLRS